MVETSLTLMQYKEEEYAKLDELILDCQMFRFNEKAALEYIRRRFKQIDRSHYYTRKKELNSDPYAQNRLHWHNSLGFVLEHFKLIDELKATKSMLANTLHQSTRKDWSNRNLMAEARIAKEINLISITLRQLILDSPFIAQMKSELNKLRLIAANKVDILKTLDERDRRILIEHLEKTDAEELKDDKELEKKIDEEIAKPLPETALTIPKDSIAGKVITDASDSEEVFE